MMRNPKRPIDGAGQPSAIGPLPDDGWYFADDRVEILLPDRRRLWTGATLVACGLAAGLISIGYFAAQPLDRATTTTTTTTVGALRLAPSLTEPAPPFDPGPPLMTGSLAPGVSGGEQSARDRAPILPEALKRARAAANRQTVSSSLMALPLPFARRDRADTPQVLATPGADRLASLTDDAGLRSLINPVNAKPPAKQTIIVVEGDTLTGILNRFDVNQSDIAAIIAGLKPVFAPDRLRAGQELALTLGRSEDGAVVPISLNFETDGREISVNRTGQRRYLAAGREYSALPGARTRTRTLARIYGSLYQTARRQQVPDSVIVRMMRAHSYDVDFQRQIRPGDPFEVFYTGGRTAVPGKRRAKLLFSSLTTAGKKRSYYRFTSPDGITDFYNAKGESSKKPLMRTPLNGARISSPFGKRKHPILGYTKMHSGTDFAAPRGTPVFAAGDGVVEMAGRNGGFGNYVRLKHQKGLVTAYAHLQRIAKGIGSGTRVRQGQIIAFVGSSGRSTGPHLHFEVAVNGKKKNPLTVKVAGSGRRLAGKVLAQFGAEKSRIDRLRQEAPASTLVAAAKL